MTKCPHHDGSAREEPACDLQRLLDHTITVTEARAPTVGCVFLVVDRGDYTHSSLAANVDPYLTIALLEHHLGRVRALVSD